MAKIKRSYYLPKKLIKVLDKEVERGGWVREMIVAASLYDFLSSSEQEREKAFARLESFLDKGKG